jgi:cytochrome c oxidase subunit 3
MKGVVAEDVIKTQRSKGPPPGGTKEDNGSGGYGGARPIANARLGLWLFLAAAAMLFVGLTSGYIILRAGGGLWPPPGSPPLPSGLWANTIIIILSSATMVWAHRSINRGNQIGLKIGLLLTALLGVAFLGRQVYVWDQLSAAGVGLGTGVYGSVFYVLTGVHGAHLAGGVVFLLFVLWQAWRNSYTDRNHIGVELAGLYWHFVDVLWVYLFVILYLI